ncbi:MAG: hypothetical protein J6M24_07405 [Lachnospiraceae bacterium]|nr:hypothetical protein [Lachnospiraceae bacterium]
MGIKEEIGNGLLGFKMGMLGRMPFYGDIMMYIPVFEDHMIKTACTDGSQIKYNPDFFALLSEGERNYVYMHEVLHILFLHWKRWGKRDRYLWNIACDYVVNGTLDNMAESIRDKNIVFEKPQGLCCIHGIYDGTSAEEYYEWLLKSKNNAAKPLMIQDISGEDFEDGIDDEAKDCEESEKEERVKELIKKAIEASAKTADTESMKGIPGSFFRLVETKRLPWYRLLRDFMTERIEDASYYTPERKYIHMGLILPGESKSDEELKEVWAFLDTSSSIGDKDMDAFITQLYRIAKEFHCNYNIAFWDTAVREVHRNVQDKEKLLGLRRKFYGGTVIDCVYEYLKTQKIDPEAMIILSDGFFGRPKADTEAYRKKTILVLTEKGDRSIGKVNSIGKLARL